MDVTKRTNSSQNQNTGSSQDLKDQVAEAGAEVRQRAGEALQASTEVAREKLSDAADAVKEVASGTVDRIQAQAREQQWSGAAYVERLAGNIRTAARAFESDAPFAVRGINSVADYVEDAAGKIRNGSFRDIIDGATDFAKRQPAAFLGISVLAGFAAVRFFKASGESQAREERSTLPSDRGDPGRGPSSAAANEPGVQGSSRRGNRRKQTQGSNVS